AWFAWEWLADVVLAWIHAAGGLQWIALFGLAAGAAYCGVVLRHMLWQGARMWVALPLSLLGFSAATLHLLSRPHLFTMLLLPLAAWWIQADLKGRRVRIWLLVPLATLWTNLHGGWLALIALLGLTAAGLAAEAWLGKRKWTEAGRYGALALACLAASLANPYGWRLHAHTFQYLRADYIRNIVGEFRAPSFRGETMLHYEVILLAAVAASGLWLARRRVVEPLWILFWAHASLESARHIPLFAGVALPLLGAEIQRWWEGWAQQRGPRSVAATLDSLARDMDGELRRATVWPVAVLALALAGILPVPRIEDFPGDRFPAAMAGRHEAMLRQARILTQDQWADYLIYRFYPAGRVFFDGRSDFYGREIALEYLNAINGHHRWREVLDKYRFDTVLLPPGMALASLLKESRDWVVVDDDGTAVLFRRRQPGGLRAALQRPGRACANCPAAAPNEIP
ncbi:MAG: hypothetical protein N2036_14175, partial [Bryobacteraceae bacterium]|nr:hypothetical protein [Bryobacteraceae bacterium]